jgi:hypothetical protein
VSFIDKVCLQRGVQVSTEWVAIEQNECAAAACAMDPSAGLRTPFY